MDFKNINQLLEKYWEGDTSLQEEATLRSYFSNGNVASEHQEFRPLFQFFKEEKEIMIGDDFEKRLIDQLEKESTAKVKKLTWMRTIRSVAAVGIILLGGFFVFQNFNKKSENPYEGRGANIIALVDIEDQDEAIAQTKAALKLISRKMKKGVDQANVGFSQVKAVNKNPLKN